MSDTGPMRRVLLWGLLGVGLVAGAALGLLRHLPDETTYTAAWDQQRPPTVSADGRVLTVPYIGGDCDRSAHADQQWSHTQLVVTIRVRSASTCDLQGLFRTLVVHLDHALGARVVVEGGCDNGPKQCRLHPGRTA